MNKDIRWRRVATGIVGAGIALLLLGGCAGGGGGASSSSADDASAADVAASDSNAEATEAGTSGDGDTGTGTDSGGSGSAGSGSGTPAPAPAAGSDARAIVYTGSISVKVRDLTTAADRAVDIAVGAGGHVGADRRTSRNNQSDARLTLRIPADAFSTTLDALAKLGSEESRSITTADVSEAVIDLDARIVSQRASVDRVRALLAKAKTISEVVSIESELTRRESDLASLQARKRDLADKVALSTLTLHLSNRSTVGSETGKSRTGFVAGLVSGWHAFVVSIRVVLTMVGALLPFLVLLGLPTVTVLWLARRRRRARTGSVGPTAPIPPTGRDVQA